MVKREHTILLQNFEGQKIKVHMRGYENGMAYLEHTRPTTGKNYVTEPVSIQEGFAVAQERGMKLVDEAEKKGYTIIHEVDSVI